MPVLARQTIDQVSYSRIDDLNREPFSFLSDNLLFCGDAEKALELLPSESVQTVVTSPPYWSLRDYKIENQIGRDESLENYIESIVQSV